MFANLSRIQRNREVNGERGFTLIELLIVIVVLGILIAIGILSRVHAEASLATASQQDAVLSVAVTTPVAGAAAQEITLPANTQSVNDFYAEDQIKQVYYPEVACLLQETLGASRVFAFDHNVRNAGRPGMAEPSRRVHNDHTVTSAPRRVRDHLGADAPELLKHRFGVVNVWRPIRGPVLDSPLALCDARSFSDDDLIASDLVYNHVRGETSSVAYRPSHRWYYFSEMQPDEVVLIRVHDSANDGRARLSFHTSFENPLAPGAPQRESIEVRTLVFF